MMEDEFFSDNSDSDDSTDSLTRHQSINYDANNFTNVYEHKQIETLRFLRLTLKENKILKRRLNIVEGELERYEDFKTILPAVDSTDDASTKSESPVNEAALLVTTDDKECQVELIVAPILNEKTPTPVVSRPASTVFELAKSEEDTAEYVAKSQESFTQVTDLNEAASEKLLAGGGGDDSELVSYQMPEVVRLDKGCQCDIKVNQETVMAGKDLGGALEAMRLEKDGLQEEKDSLNDEIGGLNKKIYELKLNNKNLLEKYDAMMSSHELTNGLLNEAKCQLLIYKESSDKYAEIQASHSVLEATIVDLHKEIAQRDLKLQAKSDEIEKMNETVVVLSANFEIMDKQREKIEFLEAECEKHLTEKHVECERRINELTMECQNNTGFIQAQKNELSTLNSQLADLGMEMERSRRELQSFNFKEFIAVKRELAQMKQEREKQFAKMAKRQQEKEAQSVKAPVQALPLPPIQHKENPSLENKKPQFKFFD